MSEDLSSLGGRLKWARSRRGKSARELSLAIGKSQSLVGQIERGDVESPGSAVCVALAAELDVPVGWLVAGEGALPDIPSEGTAA